MDKCGACLPSCCEGLFRYLGQTVTIFTASGGISGSGFTGVLLNIDENCIRLLTSFGLAPACPVGSSCCGGFDRIERERLGYSSGYGSGYGFGGSGSGGYENDSNGYCGNPFGSICVIPTCAVVSYVVPSI